MGQSQVRHPRLGLGDGGASVRVKGTDRTRVRVKGTDRTRVKGTDRTRVRIKGTDRTRVKGTDRTRVRVMIRIWCFVVRVSGKVTSQLRGP